MYCCVPSDIDNLNPQTPLEKTRGVCFGLAVLGGMDPFLQTTTLLSK